MVAQDQHKPTSTNEGISRTFVFEETQFTAVTAYQNQQVSRAKRGWLTYRHSCIFLIPHDSKEKNNRKLMKKEG